MRHKGAYRHSVKFRNGEGALGERIVMDTPLTHTARPIPASSRPFIRCLPLALALGLGITARSQDAFPADEMRLTFSIQVTTKGVLTGDPTCPFKLVIEGVALTNLLGPVHDNASHCVRADGSADHGVFTFIAAALGGPPGGEDSQDSITGQYVAHVVPTANSVFPATPASPPGGYWLVYEAFCVWKGTGKYAAIANDCPTSTSPGRFFPARGSVDFDTGQANIYGTALVRVAFE